MKARFLAYIATTAVIALGLTVTTSSADVFYKFWRSVKPRMEMVKLLQSQPMVVVTNDALLYNTWRSRFPNGGNFEFVPLDMLDLRAAELQRTHKTVVFLIDRSRGNIPIERHKLVPHKLLTLIRPHDVVIASESEKLRDKDWRANIVLSAPSFNSLLDALDKFLVRTPKDWRNMKFMEMWQVPVSVVISNASQEIVNAFGESTRLDYVLGSFDKLSDAAERLAVTETEVYILLGDKKGRAKEMHRPLPFSIKLLRDNQSAVVRQSKGGKFHRVLFYSPTSRGLKHLVRRYKTLEEIPSQPLVITHPDLRDARRVVLVPFADLADTRAYISGFDDQVIEAMVNMKLFNEIAVAQVSDAPDLARWQQWQSGEIGIDSVRTLAQRYGADMVMAGRLVNARPRTVMRHELSSRPAAARDMRWWDVKTIRDEAVTAQIECRLFDGETGLTAWVKNIDAASGADTAVMTRKIESGANKPPKLPYESVELEVTDVSLYQSAAIRAIEDLVYAIRGETLLPEDRLTEPIIVAPQPVPQTKPAAIMPRSVLAVKTPVAEVAAIEGDVLYLDAGARQGIRIGMVFTIVREKKITSSRKEVIISEVIAKVKVIQIFDEVVKAELLTIEAEGNAIRVGDKAKAVAGANPSPPSPQSTASALMP